MSSQDSTPMALPQPESEPDALAVKEYLFKNLDTLPVFSYSSIPLPLQHGQVLVQVLYAFFSAKIDLNFFLNAVNGSLENPGLMAADAYTQKSLGRVYVGRVYESSHPAFTVGDSVVGVKFHPSAVPPEGTLRLHLCVDPKQDPLFVVPASVHEATAARKLTRLNRRLYTNYCTWLLHYVYALQVLCRHAAKLNPLTRVLVIRSDPLKRSSDMLGGSLLADAVVDHLCNTFSVSEIAEVVVLDDVRVKLKEEAFAHTGAVQLGGLATGLAALQVAYRFTHLLYDGPDKLYTKVAAYQGQSSSKFNYIINCTNRSALAQVLPPAKLLLLLAPRASGSGLISMAYGYDVVDKPWDPVLLTTYGGPGDPSTWGGWLANSTTLPGLLLLYTEYRENVLDLKVICKAKPLVLDLQSLQAAFNLFYDAHVAVHLDELQNAPFDARSARCYPWLELRDRMGEWVALVNGRSGRKAVLVDDDDRRVLFRIETF